MVRRTALLAVLLAGPAGAQTMASLPAGGPAGGKAALPGAAPVRPASGPGEVAKGAPVNGVLVLYGNQRCPTDNDGNEVVVCERRSASEQFRVPKEMRELQVTPQNQSWAAKAGDTIQAGAGVNGIGTCSAIGVGGASGCLGQATRVNRGLNRQRRTDETPVGY